MRAFKIVGFSLNGVVQELRRCSRPLHHFLFVRLHGSGRVARLRDAVNCDSLVFDPERMDYESWLYDELWYDMKDDHDWFGNQIWDSKSDYSAWFEAVGCDQYRQSEYLEKYINEVMAKSSQSTQGGQGLEGSLI